MKLFPEESAGAPAPAGEGMPHDEAPVSTEALMVLKSAKFRRWRQRVESHGNTILSVEVLSVISRRPGSWYAAFLDCVLLTPEGTRIARCLTLRGESVVIVPLLLCADDGAYYTLMVEQRCICDGGLHAGFPAGGVEEGTEVAAMACRELREETGLEVSPEDLVALTDGIVLNSSLSDDLVHFYGVRREVSRSWLDRFDNQNGGLGEEGEHLKIRVRSLADCSRMHTTSTLIGLTLLARTFGITVAAA